MRLETGFLIFLVLSELLVIVTIYDCVWLVDAFVGLIDAVKLRTSGVGTAKTKADPLMEKIRARPAIRLIAILP